MTTTQQVSDTPTYDAVKQHVGFDPTKLRPRWTIEAAKRRIARAKGKRA